MSPPNPVKPVKELRRQQLAPKGLERPVVRRLLRESSCRQDVRAVPSSPYSYTPACRVGDAVALELDDLMLGERSGSVVFRLGKGNSSGMFRLPSRPVVPSKPIWKPVLGGFKKGFHRRKGPLTDRGIRALCDKYRP